MHRHITTQSIYDEIAENKSKQIIYINLYHSILKTFYEILNVISRIDLALNILAKQIQFGKQIIYLLIYFHQIKF